MKKEDTRKVIRFLAGGYLTYLAFQLFTDIRTEEMDLTFTLIFGGFALLFAAIGFLLMFFVLRDEIRRVKKSRQESSGPVLPGAAEDEIDTVEDETETDDTTDNDEE